MNALVNSIAAKTEAEAPVAETKLPNAADLNAAEDEADDDNAYAGERMVNLGIEPIRASTVESELKNIFEANGVDYVHNPALINDVGHRIVDELELMIRMLNPESQYKPEWLEQAEEGSSVLSTIINREDLASVYRDSLVETYEAVNEDIADGIIEYITGVVSDHEGVTADYYENENNAGATSE